MYTHSFPTEYHFVTKASATSIRNSLFNLSFDFRNLHLISTPSSSCLSRIRVRNVLQSWHRERETERNREALRERNRQRNGEGDNCRESGEGGEKV